MVIKEICDELYELSKKCKNHSETELGLILNKINLWYLHKGDFEELNEVLNEIIGIQEHELNIDSCKNNNFLN